MAILIQNLIGLAFFNANKMDIMHLIYRLKILQILLIELVYKFVLLDGQMILPECAQWLLLIVVQAYLLKD